MTAVLVTGVLIAVACHGIAWLLLPAPKQSKPTSYTGAEHTQNALMRYRERYPAIAAMWRPRTSVIREQGFGGWR